ncbi:hypothetical protein BG262_09255 [Floricoccus penangensis]|uniref:CNA-B domain-containing protein n=1 Tax=Floricoccus penangensis TaxID=1859475 RepID=A0A9Q5JHF1_9LACT|nr:Cna B-type domain-containing protein [Floricoccus penangensis]OFI47634.1 hypothetical protein BG262_09255 [Floricoccus penangensis]
MINKIQKPITLLMLLLMLPFASIGEVVALTVDQSNKNDVVLLDENKEEAKEVTTDKNGVVDFYAGVTNGDTLRLMSNQPVELSTVDTGLTITPIDQTTYDLSWVKVGSNTSKVKLKTSGDSDLQLKLASKDNESTKTLLIQKALAVTEKTEESVPASESSKDEDTTPSTSVDETPKKSEEKKPDASAVKDDSDGEKAAIVAAVDGNIKVESLDFVNTPDTLEYWQTGSLNFKIGISGNTTGTAIVRYYMSSDFSEGNLVPNDVSKFPDIPGSISKTLGSKIIDGRMYYYVDYLRPVSSQVDSVEIPYSLTLPGLESGKVMPQEYTKDFKIEVINPLTNEVVGETKSKQVTYTTPELKLRKGVNALKSDGTRIYDFGSTVTGNVIGTESQPGNKTTDENTTNVVMYDFYPYFNSTNYDSKSTGAVFNDYKIQDTLPEGAVFRADLNPNWEYNETTRVATYVGNKKDKIGFLNENSVDFNARYSSTSTNYVNKNTLYVEFPNTKEGVVKSNTSDISINQPGTKFTVSSDKGVTYNPYDDNKNLTAESIKDIKTQVLDASSSGSGKYSVTKKANSTKYYDTESSRETSEMRWNITASSIDIPNWEKFKLTDFNLDDRFYYSGLSLTTKAGTGNFDVYGKNVDGTVVLLKKNLTSSTYDIGREQGLKLESIWIEATDGFAGTTAGSYIVLSVRTKARDTENPLITEEKIDLAYNSAQLDAKETGKSEITRNDRDSYPISRKDTSQNVIKYSDSTIEFNKNSPLNAQAKIYGVRGGEYSDIHYAVLLPENLSMDEIYAYYEKTKELDNKGFTNDSIVTNPDIQLDLNYKGTGRPAFVYTADKIKLNKDDATIVQINNENILKPTIFTPKVSYVEQFFSAKNLDDKANYTISSAQNDKYDINNNGITTDKISYQKQKLDYLIPKLIAGQKKTKGEYDTGFTLDPVPSYTSKEKGSVYQFQIVNTTTAQQKDLVVFDTLPFIGDTDYTGDGVLKSRGSEYRMELKGPVTNNKNAKVLYTTNPIPNNQKDLQAFLDNENNWTETVNDYSEVTTFKIVGINLGANEKLQVNYETDVQNDAKVGQKAVNSFGIVQNGTMLESNKTTTYIDDNLTNISIEKVWNDSNDKLKTRPDSIQVEIYQNGKLFKTETLSSKDVDKENSNKWKFIDSELPAYDKENYQYSYTIKEVPVDGYVSEPIKDGDKIIGFTNTLNTITISGQKIWIDNNNINNNRPNTIKVNVKNGNEVVATTEVSAKDDWKYKFENLPVGENINYSISEDDVQGYSSSVNGNNITNTEKLTSLKVTKIWNDESNKDGKRPENITVNLLANGQPALDKDGKQITQKLSAPESDSKSDTWTYEFENLPKFKDGNEVKYSVDEVNIPSGYTKEVDDSDKTNIIVTNSHIPEKTSITVNKIWDDGDNQDHVRPLSIQVKLLADEKDTGIIKTITPDVAGNWSISFDNLDKNSGGSAINYSFEEIVPKGYESKISGATITNTHKTATVRVTAEKVWKDEDDKDGIRPENVQFQLYKIGADGEKVTVGKPVTLSKSTEWNDLPENDNGIKIKYEVEEVSVKEGYTSSAKEVSDGVWVITNSHNPTPPITPTTTTSIEPSSASEESSSTTTSSEPTTSSESSSSTTTSSSSSTTNEESSSTTTSSEPSTSSEESSSTTTSSKPSTSSEESSSTTTSSEPSTSSEESSSTTTSS